MYHYFNLSLPAIRNCQSRLCPSLLGHASMTTKSYVMYLHGHCHTNITRASAFSCLRTRLITCCSCNVSSDTDSSTLHRWAIPSVSMSACLKRLRRTKVSFENLSTWQSNRCVPGIDQKALSTPHRRNVVICDVRQWKVVLISTLTHP